MTFQPTLLVDYDLGQVGSAYVGVRNLGGSYSVRVASCLEDVCGNGLVAAFDRPLRSGSDLAIETANCSIPFHVAH